MLAGRQQITMLSYFDTEDNNNRGVDFYKTCSTVFIWAAVRTMMVMSKLYNLHTRSIDFVLAYTQAEVKMDIYLHPPAGIIINTHRKDQVLKLKNNLYSHGKSKFSPSAITYRRKTQMPTALRQLFCQRKIKNADVIADGGSAFFKSGVGILVCYS